MKAKHWIPLALFGVLVSFLAVGLTRDPRELPSPLIDKPAPRFNLPQVAAVEQRFAPAVGLMLMDMILGPAQSSANYEEAGPGLMSNVNVSINSLLKRFRGR